MTRGLRLARSFSGNFVQLQWFVEQAGIAGSWEELLGGHCQFRDRNGGILNWWQTTGTLTLQGNAKAARALEEALMTTFVSMAGDVAHAPVVPRNLRQIRQSAIKPSQHCQEFELGSQRSHLEHYSDPD